MDKSLLDTDIFSEVIKRVDHLVIQKTHEYIRAFNRYSISTITVMEIVKGLHKARRDDRIKQLLSSLPLIEILTLDVRSADLAGRSYGDLERLGKTIGRADPMIAAIAINNGLTLVSGNVTHYQRIQELGYPLVLDNWRE